MYGRDLWYEEPSCVDRLGFGWVLYMSHVSLCWRAWACGGGAVEARRNPQPRVVCTRINTDTNQQHTL